MTLQSQTRIQDLFARDIHRPINGVVKADQRDAAAVWQELDEFVVTRELNGHIAALVAVLLQSLEQSRGTDTADKNGIWVSGFFGCGKSHFIKVLSYLLQNEEHALDGASRLAVDFFHDKLPDALLYADLKRAVATTTDTILFNIDSKADHSSGRDALLQVFLKVLNEKQGYSGDHPHIAHMERHLDERGKLQEFHAAFEHHAGEPWLEQRDAWEFYRDDVTSALQETLGLSAGATQAWVEGAEGNFSLTVENFAKWVKRYLDRQGPQRRLMFLVDEVGQFIGNDTHLMLNLQTITEQLGTICQGRAWVLVTSQEDLDAVLGDLKSTKQHDFSKIQGRFKTRLSLSSSNVDEVIKKRLLDKREEASTPLRAAYEGKHDILNNQLAFSGAGMTFDHFEDVSHFSGCYPFAAYQFRLVQKVFESIRKAGATGLHLSQGERSTLDAFQSAAIQLADKSVGALVPFYAFYPAVEGFLDTAVKRTIDQARDNSALEPFDNTLLRVLFLIRYIDELPGNVDNLVTLCVGEIDADRLALRKQIESSLTRLEGETLIARNGDLYFFLTNEERDIGREIKNETIPSGAEERELGKLLFEDLLGDMRKHTFAATRKDFAFNRICDDFVLGNKLEGNLEVGFATPLGDRYGELSRDDQCVLATGAEQSRVLIRLPDDANLGRELRTYLQTELYVRTKNTGSLPTTTKRILAERSEENRARRQRLVTMLDGLLGDATYFACGSKVEVKKKTASAALGEALDYLILNAYSKMNYLQHLAKDPALEIQTTLRANDIEQVGLGFDTTHANHKAIADLRHYLDLCSKNSRNIILSELINGRYGRRPYGWPELEVVLLVARLAALKEINLVVDEAPLPLDRAYEYLTKHSKQRKVILRQRQVVDHATLSKAQKLGKDLFEQMGPESEEALHAFLQQHLQSWATRLREHRALADTGNYPGGPAIARSLETTQRFVRESDSKRFLERFVEREDELLNLADDYSDVDGFYRSQRHTWDQLRKALTSLHPNRHELAKHAEGGPALKRMQHIRAAEQPYGLLHEVANLVRWAKEANTALVVAARAPVLKAIADYEAEVAADLEKVAAPDRIRDSALEPLQELAERVTESESIAHIQGTERAAQAAHDEATRLIETFVAEEQARLAREAEAARKAAAAKADTGADSAASGSEGKAEEPPPTAESETETRPPLPPVKPPAIKPRHVVKVADLYEGSYLETQEAVDAFVEALKRELDAAIEANKRIQLR